MVYVVHREKHLAKEGWTLSDAKYINDGEDALCIDFPDGEVKYVPERTCIPTWEPNCWGFSTAYCKCGQKLLEVANGLDERLPNYCSKCGVKVVEE